MIEEWKTIKDYPDYQISNLGKVKSFKKHNGTNERILIPGKNKNGYSLVGLSKNRIKKTTKVHRLVLLAFKPINNPQDFECNHINGIKDDNGLSNLEWCTGSENQKHAFRIGLNTHKGENNPNYGKYHSEESKRKISKNHGDVKGEKSPNHKLTEKEVIDIRELLNKRIPQVKIAKMYNVTQPHISRIKLGKVW
jgi:hypothetical protein